MIGGLLSERMENRVSRETHQKLLRYIELLNRWQKTINLVSPITLPNAWTRHVLDSFQLWAHVTTQADHWLDIGSGAGFPGLVIAITAPDVSPNMRTTLIESDIRKCAFMREVARITETPISILSRRIEDAPPQAADVISARALSGLPNLLSWAQRHAGNPSQFLFPKGVGYRDELVELASEWQNRMTVHPSETDPDAAILAFSYSTK